MIAATGTKIFPGRRLDKESYPSDNNNVNENNPFKLLGFCLQKEILSHLDGKTVARLQLVDKSWAYTPNRETLWKNLIEKDFPEVECGANENKSFKDQYVDAYHNQRNKLLNGQNLKNLEPTIKIPRDFRTEGSVDTSPDGHIVFADRSTASFVVCDSEGHQYGSGEACRVRPKVQFSVDGKYVLSLGFRKHVSIYRINAGLLSPICPILNENILGMACSPTENIFATWDNKGNLDVYNFQGEKLVSFDNEATITYAEFSPDGTQIVANNEELDNSIFLWDLNIKNKKGGSVKCFSSNDVQLNNSCIHFSSDGNYLVSLTPSHHVNKTKESSEAEKRGRINVWNIKNKEKRAFLTPKCGANVFAVANNKIAYCDDDKLFIFDYAEIKPVMFISATLDSRVKDIVFSPDNRLLAVTTGYATYLFNGDGEYINHINQINNDPRSPEITIPAVFTKDSNGLIVPLGCKGLYYWDFTSK